MSIIDTLITDRTRADVDRLAALAEKGWDAMTEDERGEWRYGKAVPFLDSSGEQLSDRDGEPLECREGVQRGAYNASDLNRVGEAIAYLAGRLRGAGYVVPVSPKIDWTMDDVPTADQMARYLDAVSVIRSVLPVLPTTPEVPADMEGLTWAEANNIEQILKDIDHLITNMTAAWFYSGDLYAGEV